MSEIQKLPNKPSSEVEKNKALINEALQAINVLVELGMKTDEQPEYLKLKTVAESRLLRMGAEYDKNGRIVLTDKLIDFANYALESRIANNLFDIEKLDSGDLEYFFDDRDSVIGFESEIENESRLTMKPKSADDIPTHFDMHVVDVYDASGRCRIRIKNGSPRMSLKIPLFSRETSYSKSCVRIEFKPQTKQQINELLRIRQLITLEQGAQVREKFGKKVITPSGRPVWLNKDSLNNYWVELDDFTPTEGLDGVVPDGFEFINYSKGTISTGGRVMKESITEQYLANLSTTSRTAKKGVIDTSVSSLKSGTDKTIDQVLEQTKVNAINVLKYIDSTVDQHISNGDMMKSIILKIARLVNSEVANEGMGDEYRIHTVPYGRKLTPDQVSEAMDEFCQELVKKINQVVSNNLKPVEVAAFAEYVLDREIHPFKDGCGRIAKALGAFILMKFDQVVLPDYGTREEYYEALNTGFDVFLEYYKLSCNRSLQKHMH